MSSIRGIRRKKSSLTEVKIAVIGAAGVGKTALTVRFLTKRYIGEYDHQTESRYKHEALVDGEPVLFEILDTCPSKGDEGCICSAESALWADGFLLVYSITDRRSFSVLQSSRQAVCEWREACGVWPTSTLPAVVVASKGDMVHLRQVTTEEGESFAKDLECPYYEVTAAEQVTPVTAAFHEICREVLSARRRGKQSLLDRMLGNKAARPPPSGPRTYIRGKSDSALP